MTEFDQAQFERDVSTWIVHALTSTVRQLGLGPKECISIATALAPRVAAAIEAAIESACGTGGPDYDSDMRNLDEVRSRATALDSLRGKP